MNIRKTYSAVSASVAFALVGATPTASVAATIYACVNNSGSVKIVAAGAVCGNNETSLSWAAVGPAGPQGIQGPAGPQGPAGRARDVGSVFPGTPDFYPQGLVGWVAVEHPSLGTYCLTPDPSVTLDNAVLMLTVGSPGATSQGQAIWTGYCGLTPLKFQVQTVTFDGSLTDLVYFTAMVP